MGQSLAHRWLPAEDAARLYGFNWESCLALAVSGRPARA